MNVVVIILAVVMVIDVNNGNGVEEGNGRSDIE